MTSSNHMTTLSSVVSRKKGRDSATADKRLRESRTAMNYTYKDREFVFVDQLQQYLEELLCPICHEIVEEPQQTTCGHLFCKKCIHGVRGQHGSYRAAYQQCPVCRQNCSTHSDNFTERRVKNLRVSCPNQEQGCAWVGGLGDAMDHLNSQDGCANEDVNCPYGCGQCSQRKTINNHIMKNCPNRKYSCPHCGKIDTYVRITTTHYEKCEKFPLPCPNACDEVDIERCEVQNHLDYDCPKEKVDCTYKILGCNTQVERKLIGEHIANSKDEHLQLAMDKVVHLSHQLTELIDIVATLGESVEEMKQKEEARNIPDRGQLRGHPEFESSQLRGGKKTRYRRRAY